MFGPRVTPDGVMETKWENRVELTLNINLTTNHIYKNPLTTATTSLKYKLQLNNEFKTLISKTILMYLKLKDTWVLRSIYLVAKALYSAYNYAIIWHRNIM